MSEGVQLGGGVSLFGQRIGQPGEAGGEKNFRVDFNITKFETAIKTKGEDVVWTRALYCPNRKGLAPKDHAITCTTCDNGFVYYGSLNKRMLLQNVSLSQQYYSHGRFDAGSVVVTALPGCRLSYWDKLVACDRLSRFTELVQRASGSLVDRTKYDVEEIEQVQWVDRSEAIQVATIGTDIDIDSSGGLVWASAASRPEPDAYYAVSYYHHPTYIITEMMHQHRVTPVKDTTTTSDNQDTHHQLPIQAMAKLDFLVRDESTDASEIRDTNPFGT